MNEGGRVLKTGVFNPQKTSNMFAYIMGCSCVGSNVTFTTDISYVKELLLKLYDIDNKLLETINLESYMINSVISSVTLCDPDKKISFYEYVSDGKIVSDDYMKKSASIKKWGCSDITKSAVYYDEFDWGIEKKPNLTYSDTISYLLHVRGYSMEDTSVSKHYRGTYSALVQKIPYFREMGINQIILMPAYDFDEIIKRKHQSKESLPTINYWGYTYACYFDPKSSFALKDEVSEYKEMVKNLHMSGIEVIMQFYFPNDYSKNMINEVLRHWAFEYHVDGFYLMGADLPTDIILSDRALADIKFYFPKYYLDKVKPYGMNKCNRISYFDEDYSNVLRRFLKSDENMLSGFSYHISNNPTDIHVVNYVTTFEGFTLNDLVSYDRKHNEDNQEDNRDGNDNNYSWNCGIEGPSKKKAVAALRIRQVKNALTLLMLSQGTPMLLGGDENLNSQNGNNNAYCQDNKIGHIDWKVNKDRVQIREYLKELILIRKNHPILHMDSEMRIMDYKSVGYPDMSFHQDDAYRTHFEPPYRHIGIMYCGKYANKPDGNTDDYFYIAANMHWENQKFALPRLPKDLCWKVAIYTGDDTECELLKEQIGVASDYIEVPYRSVAVFRSSEQDKCR